MKTLPLLILLILLNVHLIAQSDLNIEGDNPILTIEATSNNPKIQLTTDASNTTNGWVILFDENDSGQFKLRYNNATKLFLFQDGKLVVNGVLQVNVTETTTSASSNVVRKSDKTLAIRQYQLGDNVHGGTVFWVDETGEHGLVCSSADLASAAWGPTNIRVGAIRDNKYGGMLNTERIINSLGTNSYAADLCAKHNGGGYGDWFMPTLEEVNLMYSNLHQSNLGSFDGTALYWSSTEHDINEAWSKSFNSGNNFKNLKSMSSIHVRAVRVF